MKKLIVVCAAVLMFAAIASAADFTFGVKAGVSLSNIRWSDDDGSETSLIRPTFGLLGAYNLSPALAIQAELNYLITGEKWADTDGYSYVEAYNYLHIPVLVKYRFIGKGNIVPFVFGGPSIGILIGGGEKEYLNGELNDEWSAKDWMKSTDFGADFGAGIEFRVSNMKLFTELRYCLGLTNAYQFTTKFSAKNSTIVLSIGALL
jgi:hypothetical protein